MEQAPPQLINDDPGKEGDPVPVVPKRRMDTGKVLMSLILLLLIGVLALQVIQLRRLDATQEDVVALTEDVTDLKPLRRDVDILGDQVAALDGQIEAAVTAAGASPAAVPTQATDGSLPPFEDSANDAAVLGQMTHATINGTDYYTNTELTWSPDDGKARVWLIWAHWCPYCQAELPDLDGWWIENNSRFPNVELVTITTAIDDTAANPLIPYLDAEQFPFPVVIDESGSMSQMFGTTAFPFWVVTDNTGTVVLRVAGALGIESVDQIFAQLETMSAET